MSFSSCTAFTNSVPTSTAYSLGNAFAGGYFYFSKITSAAVYKCNYDPTQSPQNAVSSCTQQTISGLLNPRSMAFSRGKVFITDSNGSSTGQLISCDITPSNGSLTSCNAISTPGITMRIPIGIAINNDYLYMSDFSGNTVYYCSMSGSSISSCSSVTSSSRFVNAKQIAIYNDYAYIVNASPSTPGAVTSCYISNGSFSISDCQQALGSSGFTSPQSIAIYNGNAYITDLTNATNHITVCTSVANGIISGCQNTSGASVTSPASISIF